MDITLRPVNESDSEMILQWRNEITTIPWMGATRQLSFNEHQAWFLESLTDPKCLFYIIESDLVPVGQIRYHIVDVDWLSDVSKVSINITNNMHSKGIASIAFRIGSESVRKEIFSKNIFAYVRLDNIGSIKAMENAGFIKDKIVTVNDAPHLIMIDYFKD